MKVEGEGAARYNAVRLNSFAVANRGILTFADEESGNVKWTDKGEADELSLGPNAIKIVLRGPRGS